MPHAHTQPNQLGAAQHQYIHDIYIMNADGSNSVRFTDGSAQVRLPAWSPDGKHIAYSSNQDGSFDIWVASVDGKETRKLKSSEVADELGATWSADGKTIVYNSVLGKLGNAMLESINVETATPTPLPGSWGLLIDPDFANDGRTLVAVPPRTETDSVFDLVIGPVTGKLQPIAGLDTIAFLSAPKWDRGAGRIVVRASFASLGDIYLVDTRTGSCLPVVTGPYEERDPDWAPDDSRIVFASDRGDSGSFDLYMYEFNAIDPVALTSTADIDEIEPAWSPDGQKIAYVGISANLSNPTVAVPTHPELLTAGRFFFRNNDATECMEEQRGMAFAKIKRLYPAWAEWRTDRRTHTSSERRHSIHHPYAGWFRTPPQRTQVAGNLCPCK